MKLFISLLAGTTLASQWELVNPDDLVADCWFDCRTDPGFMEGSCDGHCGFGGYCCNGATEDAPYNICNSDQMAPLLQHSPRIIHHVCVKPMADTTTTAATIPVDPCDVDGAYDKLVGLGWSFKNVVFRIQNFS